MQDAWMKRRVHRFSIAAWCAILAGSICSFVGIKLHNPHLTAGVFLGFTIGSGIMAALFLSKPPKDQHPQDKRSPVDYIASLAFALAAICFLLLFILAYSSSTLAPPIDKKSVVYIALVVLGKASFILIIAMMVWGAILARKQQNDSQKKD